MSISGSPFGSIEPIKTGFTSSPISFDKGIGKSEGPKESSPFQNIFAKALGQVNESSWTAGEDTDKLISGQLENVHDMTINGAKAEVMLHLATQMASKLSSATTTLFQMQL